MNLFRFKRRARLPSFASDTAVNSATPLGDPDSTVTRRKSGIMMRCFAVSACLASLAALLYFVGFLQNWTPKGIDTGSASSTGHAVVANCALLIVFGMVHSLMARPFFKQSLRRMAPESLERSLYILVASMQLAMVVVFWSPLPAPLWTIDAHWGTLAILTLFALGNLLLIWAILCIDPWHFFGLRQVFSPAAREPQFSMRGPYRHVRHPIQTGLIIALWATPSMTVGHALLAGTLTLYSVTATLFLEERDLVNAIGPAYRTYRSKVPALLPFSLLRRRR
jgi:protein-S-isoprenylcysteine O-methyltransferase Ste14